MRIRKPSLKGKTQSQMANRPERGIGRVDKLLQARTAVLCKAPCHDAVQALLQILRSGTIPRDQVSPEPPSHSDMSIVMGWRVVHELIAASSVCGLGASCAPSSSST